MLGYFLINIGVPFQWPPATINIIIGPNTTSNLSPEARVLHNACVKPYYIREEFAISVPL